MSQRLSQRAATLGVDGEVGIPERGLPHVPLTCTLLFADLAQLAVVEQQWPALVRAGVVQDDRFHNQSQKRYSDFSS